MPSLLAIIASLMAPSAAFLVRVFAAANARDVARAFLPTLIMYSWVFILTPNCLKLALS